MLYVKTFYYERDLASNVLKMEDFREHGFVAWTFMAIKTTRIYLLMNRGKFCTIQVSHCRI